MTFLFIIGSRRSRDIYDWNFGRYTWPFVGRKESLVSGVCNVALVPRLLSYSQSCRGRINKECYDEV